MEMPRIFARLLLHLGIEIDDVLRAIESRTGITDKPQRFRSTLTPPSGARMLQPSAPEVEFHPDMPYIAGDVLPGRLHVTAICIGARLRWYSDTLRRAHLVVREMGGRMPQTALEGMIGMDACGIVLHPVLEDAGCIVRKAHGNPASLHLNVDVDWVGIPSMHGWRSPRPPTVPGAADGVPCDAP